jgi:hypothetical protein
LEWRARAHYADGAPTTPAESQEKGTSMTAMESGKVTTPERTLALLDATMAALRRSEWTCGHLDAKFPILAALYCNGCADRAWQHFIHEGHADQPQAVPLVRTVRVVKVEIGWSETQDCLVFDCGHADLLDSDPEEDHASLVGATTQCDRCKRGC